MGLEDLQHLVFDSRVPLHLPKSSGPVDRLLLANTASRAAKAQATLREQNVLELHHADHHRSRATRPGSTLEGSLDKIFGLQPTIEVPIPPRNRHLPSMG